MINQRAAGPNNPTAHLFCLNACMTGRRNMGKMINQRAAIRRITSFGGH